MEVLDDSRICQIALWSDQKVEGFTLAFQVSLGVGFNPCRYERDANWYCFACTFVEGHWGGIVKSLITECTEYKGRQTGSFA